MGLDVVADDVSVGRCLLASGTRAIARTSSTSSWRRSPGSSPSAARWCAGSIAWALGTLATTLGRYEQAEDHFAAAAEIEERFGAPLFLARTHVGWARALIARGRPEDLERAQHMLEQAEEVAERLGGGLVSREAAECRSALAAMSG